MDADYSSGQRADLTEHMGEAMHFVTEIEERIGCYGIQGWLAKLAPELGLTAEQLIPAAPAMDHVVETENGGLRLVLEHPHAGETTRGDPHRWTLLKAEFSSGWPEQWPYGLDPRTATPEMVKAVLGGDTVGLDRRDIEREDYRQSFFLPDGRIVAISWNRGLVGVEKVDLVRLGRPGAFEHTKNEKPGI